MDLFPDSNFPGSDLGSSSDEDSSSSDEEEILIVYSTRAKAGGKWAFQAADGTFQPVPLVVRDAVEGVSGDAEDSKSPETEAMEVGQVLVGDANDVLDSSNGDPMDTGNPVVTQVDMGLVLDCNAKQAQQEDHANLDAIKRAFALSPRKWLNPDAENMFRQYKAHNAGNAGDSGLKATLF